MTDDTLAICFLDTETLGLDPDAPIWEFAAIRRPDGDPERTEIYVEFTIQHDPTGWLDRLPDEFADDYRARFGHHLHSELGAALEIHSVTRGAKIIGCNPGFDLERLTKLLERNGITPEWHYHPLDITSVALGFGVRGDVFGDCPANPFRSNVMSTAVGVQPDDYARHTAMGDVLWTRAQWDAVMNR